MTRYRDYLREVREEEKRKEKELDDLLNAEVRERMNPYVLRSYSSRNRWKKRGRNESPNGKSRNKREIN